MRVEPHSTDTIIHVVKRGARGMDIVLDDPDKWHFVKSLYLVNDEYRSENWRRETSTLALFERPTDWPPRVPLVRIMAWVLMPNHFHLLLQEAREGGMSKFMQRFCGSMSLRFNLKYQSKGSIFQGSYKAKSVDEDKYLRHLLFYIQIKNVLELYPGGLAAALDNFDHAWSWALEYKFSSLPAYATHLGSPILDDRGLILTIHKEALSKQDAYEMLELYCTKSELLPDRLNDLFQD